MGIQHIPTKKYLLAHILYIRGIYSYESGKYMLKICNIQIPLHITQEHVIPLPI